MMDLRTHVTHLNLRYSGTISQNPAPKNWRTRAYSLAEHPDTTANPLATAPLTTRYPGATTVVEICECILLLFRVFAQVEESFPVGYEATRYIQAAIRTVRAGCGESWADLCGHEGGKGVGPG